MMNARSLRSAAINQFIIHHPSSSFLPARPIDPARPNSPWLVLPDGSGRDGSVSVWSVRLHGPSRRQQRRGQRRVLGGGAGGGRRTACWCATWPPGAKHGIDTVERVIEPDLLYPLVAMVRRAAMVGRAPRLHPAGARPGHPQRHRRDRRCASDIRARWNTWSDSTNC